MNFYNRGAEVLVPDGRSIAEALCRTTHLGIGAHPDDLEFMALHGIQECYQNPDKWFTGVTCTTGSGSAREGAFADKTDEEIAAIRRQEQNHAARLGGYGAMIQLGYTSADAKNVWHPGLAGDLHAVMAACKPGVIYTHNPVDRHPSHLGVLASVIRAVRSLPPRQRPVQLIGCEVWRGLDWLPDARKLAMDVSNSEALAKTLNSVFESQIAGGKRYDLAVGGRWHANATFSNSHETDAATSVILGIDLTCFVHDENLELSDFVAELLEEFRREALNALAAVCGQKN